MTSELPLPNKPTNIHLTERRIEAWNNNGEFGSTLLEGPLKDFYGRIMGDKKPSSRQKSALFTTDFEGNRYRCILADSTHGWGVTMRLLPSEALHLRDDLHLDPQMIFSLLKGSGLTLFAGKMGSGKSTTLFSALERMDKRDRGPIGTVEDPIEGLLSGPGVIQREVGTHVDSFANAIRDFMRQNRHTIGVSEIRDPETANAAVQAALTGHSVVATIHSDSGPDTINRLYALVDEKLSRILPSALRGIHWQDVVRFGDPTRSPVSVYESLEVTHSVRQIIEAGPERFPQLIGEMDRQGRKNMAQMAAMLVGQRQLTAQEAEPYMARRGRFNEQGMH